MSRESAEDLAGAYRLEIKVGRNPVEERRAVALSDKSGPHRISRTTTVRSLCESYVSLHASKKRSGKSDKRLLERFVIPAWGNREAESIGPMHGATLHM